MKKSLFASVSLFFVLAAACQAAPYSVVRPGDASLVSPHKVGAGYETVYPENPPVVPRSDYFGEGFTPFALTIGPVSIPFLHDLNLYGVGVNLGIPQVTDVPIDMYAVDVGLSGECRRDGGGLWVNVLDNDCPGVFEGIQISVFLNRTHELHGLQVGLINIADCGSGLQIGLWNKSGSGRQSPILGFVF